MEEAIIVEEPRRNRFSGHVILVALLAIFPLLALLVLQQGRVIDSQKILIRQLFADSQELNSIRMHDAQKQMKKAGPAQSAPVPSEAQQPAAKPAPDHKGKKSAGKRQEETIKPVGPQEYPASRPMPVRKAA